MWGVCIMSCANNQQRDKDGKKGKSGSKGNRGNKGNKGNKGDNGDKQKKTSMIDAVEDISRIVSNSVARDVALPSIIQQNRIRARHALNPRKPYPYNQMNASRPSLTTANTMRHNPTFSHQIGPNQGGCSACRRRLWDPL